MRDSWGQRQFIRHSPRAWEWTVLDVYWLPRYLKIIYRYSLGYSLIVNKCMHYGSYYQADSIWLAFCLSGSLGWDGNIKKFNVIAFTDLGKLFGERGWNTKEQCNKTWLNVAFQCLVKMWNVIIKGRSSDCSCDGNGVAGRPWRIA